MGSAIRVFSEDPDDWERWNEAEAGKHQPKIVPEERRADYARLTSLRQFYLDCEAGTWESMGRKRGRAPATIAKELNALNRWEKYTRPKEWPAEKHWPGPNLQFLQATNSGWIDSIYDRMRDDGLAAATVKSTRSHLSVIFRHAIRVCAMTRLPESAPIERGDEKTTIYTPDQVERVLKVLRPNPRYFAAFWLALHAGPRSIDLFTLRRSSIIQDANGRKLLDFQSRKTKKLQAVPLSKETLAVLDELPREGDLLFPGLSDPDSDDPEHSYASRIRNCMMKEFLSQAGVTGMRKPWQSARATCNERFESHRPGVGPFILGHSLQGVNARSYRQPTEAVHEAVRTLPPYSQMDRQQRLF